MERFSLPVVSPAFTAQEFSACQEKGECCNCGACCIVYDIHVPSVHGDPESPIYHKPEGEPCVQLISDGRGRLYCALQAYKDDPRYARKLKTCTNWKGNKGDVLYRPYDQLWQVFSAGVLRPQNAQQIYDLEALLLTGHVPATAIALLRRKLIVGPEELTNALKNVGRLCNDPVPFGLLDQIEVSAVFKQVQSKFLTDTRFRFGVWSMANSEHTGTRAIYDRYLASEIVA